MEQLNYVIHGKYIYGNTCIIGKNKTSTNFLLAHEEFATAGNQTRSL